MNKFGIIYMVTNLKNGKKYIGQTQKTLEQRKSGHYKRRNDGGFFHNALLKYSKEDWKWEQIDVASSQEELDKKEQYWIKFYGTFNNKEKGYNLTSGGEHNKLYSDETRRKIGLGNKGKIVSKEIRKKLSAIMKGKKLTEEQKRKMSENNKGERNGMYGKTHSEETKQKISKSCKGRIVSDDTRKLLSNINKGKIVSKETRHKISQARLGKSNGPFTEEHKQKLREVNLGGKNPYAKGVICITTGKKYGSLKEAQEDTGIHYKKISKICKGLLKPINDLEFKFNK